MTPTVTTDAIDQAERHVADARRRLEDVQAERSRLTDEREQWLAHATARDGARAELVREREGLLAGEASADGDQHIVRLAVAIERAEQEARADRTAVDQCDQAIAALGPALRDAGRGLQLAEYDVARLRHLRESEALEQAIEVLAPAMQTWLERAAIFRALHEATHSASLDRNVSAAWPASEIPYVLLAQAVMVRLQGVFGSRAPMLLRHWLPETIDALTAPLRR